MTNFECDSAFGFAPEFYLVNEFTKKYEYKMQGKVKEIQHQIQLLRNTLEKYIEKFDKRNEKEPNVTISNVDAK